jgi:hypothetical protein
MIGALGHTTCLTPPIFIVHVAKQESDQSCISSSFYDFSTGAWNSSESLVFVFIILQSFSISTLLIVVNKILKFNNV